MQRHVVSPALQAVDSKPAENLSVGKTKSYWTNNIILHDIPMLDKDAVLNAQNICSNPIHRSTEAAKSPLNNHEVTLGDTRSRFVP